MASFRFKAITASGAIERGILEAPSEAAAARLLRSEGKFPVSTRAAEAHPFATLLAIGQRFSKRGQPRRLAMAMQELASLLGAGVELDRALGILAGLSDIGPLRGSLANVRAKVRDGSSLADAMAAEPEFSRFIVSMVRSGEIGGSLETTMARLSDYLLRSVAVREAVLSALFYPMLLLASGAVSVAIILFYVLPQFAPLFADAGREMPLPARIAMSLSDFVRATWWLIAALALGGIVWLRQALKGPAFRRRLHGALLRLPLFGELLRAMEVERFLRSVGASVLSGVPLSLALGLARDVLWLAPMADAVAATGASLREGESLSGRLAQSDAFPPHTLDIVRIGEETGKLGEMLLRQADFDERRLRHTIDRLLSLLVPVITILLGLMVGGLIAAMLTAILSVNDLALQ